MVISQNRAVLLDRDGIINKALVVNGLPRSPRYIGEFEFTKDVFYSTQKLREAGYLLAVITNQPDIARRKMRLEDLEKMHESIRRELKIHEIFVCSHDSIDNCGCRKPRPGLIFEAARRMNLELTRSYFIGDRASDIKAAQLAQVHPIFIDYEYHEEKPIGVFQTFKSLKEGVDWICNTIQK